MHNGQAKKYARCVSFLLNKLIEIPLGYKKETLSLLRVTLTRREPTERETGEVWSHWVV